MADRREQERRRMTSGAAWADRAGRGFESTSVRLPDGFEFLKLKSGLMKIDVIPYIVGDRNPGADRGFHHFERTFYTHRVPGLDGKSQRYCCTAAVFKERCPVCDYLTSGAGRGDPEQQKALKAQTRQLWNVIDLNENPTKVRVFDSAYFKSFGAILRTKIKAVQDYGDFAELEGGYTLQLSVEDNPPYGEAVTNIEMLPRKKVYPESIMDQCACLDDCLVKYPYKKLEAILNGVPEDDNGHEEKKSIDRDNGDTVGRPSVRSRVETKDDDKPPPKSRKQDDKYGEPPAKRKGGKTAEECGFDLRSLVLWGKYNECEVRKISDCGTWVFIEDDGGADLGWVNPEELKKWRGREDEEPKPQARKPVDDDDPPVRNRKPTVDDDDDGDEKPAEKKSSRDDDDEPLEDDDEPAPKKPTARR